ncbi:MAG TPA: right-handed parallel beta-helix repeat-containing protein [Thermoguttaceae bacterium]|nr:right-handed parallel beta-helix repeat-containing protein [Thermoguttaceae bacterium]
MSLRWILHVLVVGMLSVHASAAQAGQEPTADFYVSPAGNDAWSGTLAEPKPDGSDGPLATLQGARDAIRRLKAQGPLERPIRVLVRGGTYRVTEPIVFAAEDSGTEQAPITYAAWPGEKPVISGGVPITEWKREGDGPLWTTVVPAVKEGEWYFRQLFVDGKRAVPARIPNDGFFRSGGPGVPYTNSGTARGDKQTKVSIFYQNDDLKPWSNLDDAVAVVYHSWTASRHRIKSLDTQKKLCEFTAPSGWPMGYWEKNQRYYVEFVREGLDAPGEWYLDRKTGVLTYSPRPGEDMTTAEVVAARPEELLRLEGDPAGGKFVDHLHFEGLSLQHTAWTMPEAETVDGQAAASLKTAAVYAVGARHCAFRECEIAHTGGYGLWLQLGSKDNRMEQCHVHDLGAGGVRIGEGTLPSEPDLQTERNEVTNCFIHDGGNVYHAGIGVWIGRSSHNTISHNDICDFLYTGVSVGWSWGYAPTTAHHNRIEYNHIHHLGWGQLSDMGGIYCLGISPGTQLRYNRIHDVLSYAYGGWGLYTDEGSTEILMENNVVYRVKDGAFHQHYGRENIVRNNVLALSATYGQIRRSREEEHSSFTLERNIIYSDGVPLLGGNWSNGNYQFDSNCYWDASGQTPKFPGDLTLAQWQEKGYDAHSIVADPKFADPQNLDFNLPPDSPALKLGFQPIDTRRIGLVGPEEWVNMPKQVERPKMLLPGED